MMGQSTVLLFLILPHIITPSHSHDDTTPGDDDDNVTTTTNRDQQRNCSNSFTLLEESLLSNENNRFNLLKTFYPPRLSPPVFITVTYRFGEFGGNQFDGSENPSDGSEGSGSGNHVSENRFDRSGNESVWYWSASEVYLVQPLDVLQYTSLFHSNLQYRSSRVDLELNRDCLGTRKDYLEILTQRVSLKRGCKPF